ncbi:uncharacterized protein LOC100830018 [Brachypodium distachyon]|uniref:Uncharacterized protein n=1 Tax=Brachypodium distachyon TaxID=15368 RepID=I1ICR9_BRADI|nr:uncharacterized protein LOC100830018 [Brachypodium distachyon]XP_024318338.1 uncharacterized protein LOC100830018 [Brachypodium distachyon]KQK00832.1 hypothetical protein BRADI_3g52102v3 [Brachypodium distachyon]|eukprot:XP_024318337.1 uncharacterized protein LOC100830018 [Brachypodium distachyon]
MASPAASAEFARETARQSLIAISQSVPDLPNPKVKPPSTPVANGYHDDGADNCRSKLISISDLSCPDALPTPCPPKNVATV